MKVTKMTFYQKYKKLGVSLASAGFIEGGECEPYFCTPKGAKIIGRAGVDGIHYCFVRGFGETVFAVSPMAGREGYVRPIAGSFEDMLRLLVASGSMAALDQAWMFDKEQFKEFVRDDPPDEASRAAFEVLKDKLGITPMPEPLEYIFKLQWDFDMSALKFSKEYYEAMEAAPVKREWKVTFDGGFSAVRGKAGREIRLDRQFTWGGGTFFVPAAYVCTNGIVVDVLNKIDAGALGAFYEKFRASGGKVNLHENPMSVNFRGELTVDGAALRQKGDVGEGWVPESLFGEEYAGENPTAKFVLEHYGLELDCPWSIRRMSFKWPVGGKREVRDMKFRLSQERSELSGGTFDTPEKGESVRFQNPRTGEEVTLTAVEASEETLDPKSFRDEDMEWPTHMTTLRYVLTPELSRESYSLRDAMEGDSPRRKDGKCSGTAVLAMTRAPGESETWEGKRICVASSHLRFEKTPVRWEFIFKEKLVEDAEVAML